MSSVQETHTALEKSINDLFDTASAYLAKPTADGAILTLKRKLDDFERSCDALLGRLGACEELIAVSKTQMNQDLQKHQACVQTLSVIKDIMRSG
mmetsp:Transcript_37444/g.72142  ORF Transcript_37444/g.72142 Transcript_37444/m.72142 type:complete len:95 (+) Transcript_37444:35-319(+)